MVGVGGLLQMVFICKNYHISTHQVFGCGSSRGKGNILAFAPGSAKERQEDKNIESENFVFAKNTPQESFMHSSFPTELSTICKN